MDKFKYYFSKIPIIGSLAVISWPAQREALFEMFLSVLFATLPIWFGGIIISLVPFFGNTPATDQSFSTFLSIYFSKIIETVSNGELLMYVAAILGPTLYLGLSSFGKKGKPFPWVRPQLVTAIIINLFVSVLFFMARDKGFAGESLLITSSFVLYFISLILLFPAMAYEHDRSKFDPASLQQGEQEDFMNGYRSHRGDL